MGTTKKRARSKRDNRRYPSEVTEEEGGACPAHSPGPPGRGQAER